MDRINQILHHKQYQLYREKNRVAEADRRFCHHNMAHFLDVARIAMLINLQDDLQIDKDLIYAAAFLHDVGRFVEYGEGRPHDIVSAEIAEKLLPECGFTREETQIITKAIMGHRRNSPHTSTEDQEIPAREQMLLHRVETLGALLKRADKMSRGCLWCEAKEECNWSEEEKNRDILW